MINESKKAKSQRELAELFSCDKTQIQNTLANQDRYVKQWEENFNKNVKKRKWQPFEEVNNAVLESFNRACSKVIPISGPMLQEKARKFASDFCVENFSASNSWLGKFRVRRI